MIYACLAWYTFVSHTIGILTNVYHLMLKITHRNVSEPAPTDSSQAPTCVHPQPITFHDDAGLSTDRCFLVDQVDKPGHQMDDSQLYTALIQNAYKPATAKKYLSWYRMAPSLDLEGIRNWLDHKKSNTSILGGIRKCLQIDEIDNSYLQPLAAEYKRSKELFAVQKPETPDRDYTWDTIHKLLESATEKMNASVFSIKDFKFWLILSLLSRGFVLRTQDYASTALVENDEETTSLPDNYLEISSGKWIIRDYKNDKYNGTRQLLLPKDLVNQMIQYRQKAGITAPWLFPADNGTTKTTADALSKWLRRSPLKAGTQMLRTLYVSNRVDEGMTGNQRVEMADTMDHSVLTQHTVYSKKSKTMGYTGGSSDELASVLTRALEIHGRDTIVALLKAIL